MNRFILILLILCCSFSLMANTNEIELYTEQFPPYNFREAGEVLGINTKLIKQACDRANIVCKITLMPWNRAVQLVQSNVKAGVFSTSRTPERELQFSWVGPLVYSNTCFYKLSTRSDIQIDNEQDLLNYTVGIARGDIYQIMLNSLGMKQGKHYLTFAQKHKDTRMFKLGKLDLLIGSSITLEKQLSEVQLSTEEVTPVFELKDARLKGNFLALNPAFDRHVAQALQAAIDELKQDGTLNDIIIQYLGQPEPNQTKVAPHLARCLSRTANY